MFDLLKQFDAGSASPEDQKKMIETALKALELWLTEKRVAKGVGFITKGAGELQAQQGKKVLLTAETDDAGHIIVGAFERLPDGTIAPEPLGAYNVSNLKASTIKTLLNGIAEQHKQQLAG
jgi:hypothetical protein